MKSFHLKIEKIAGAESSELKTAVFSKRVGFEDGVFGNVVGCCQVWGVGFDPTIITGDIFELFTKRLEDSGEGILEALREGKQSTTSYLENKGAECSFAFAVFYQEACYILRSGERIKIHIFGEDASGEISFGEGSGVLRDGEVVVIGTDKFFEKFETGGLSKIKEAEFEEMVDGLATTVSSEEEQAEIGACLVFVKEEKAKSEENEKEDAEPLNLPEGGNQTGILENKEAEAMPESTEEKVQDNTFDEPITSSAASDHFGKEKKEKKPGFISKIIGALFKEFVRLRSGDIGAVLRLRRNIVMVAVLLLLLLFGSIGYSLWQNNKKSEDSKISSYVASATSKYNEAISLVDLNRDRAREVLVEAQGDVNSALKIDSKSNAALKLKDQIDAKLKETESKQTVKFDTVADLGEGAVSISPTGKSLIAVTQSGVKSVDLSSGKVDDLGKISGGEAGVFWSNAEYVLAGKSIDSVDLLSQKVKEISKIDSSAHDIDVFFGNIYLLRDDGITKLIPIADGYSASDYLSSKQDFGESSRMAIDTSIWITKGSKILKFTRANEESFNISGLVSAKYSFGPIFTIADSNNLYVIDSENSAMLVISKDGQLDKVYQGSEFKNANDLAIDEGTNTMYLAVGQKILKASL